ncbi:hypothetical protein THAOC_12154 [Thalassiosira oceanica]|uniref:Uncharacterized protein n=1 Tax=Thalassiosira oceanica TaxID=159749 RepID=K0SKP8_THAOC|nr:hypothetical protein THAOC_12154 [Thalassiosira oceanica]|eukprot:EJK66878.1 hypothetical protein THAOC_12154 [Thalassiosira oceanica]
MIVNTKCLQHLRALGAALAGTLAGGTINGRGRITLEDGKTLVLRDGHFELLTDEDVDGDARALGIRELETLVTTEIAVSRGKFEGLTAQLSGNNGKGQFYVLVNVDGAISTTRINNRSIGFSIGPDGLRRSPRLRAKQPDRNPEVALPGNILASLSMADALSLIEADALLPPPAAPPAPPQPEEVVVEPAEAPAEAPEPPAGEEDDDVQFGGEDAFELNDDGEFELLDDDDELDDDEGRGVKRDRAQQAVHAGDQPEGPGEDGLPASKRARVDGGYEWSPAGEAQRPVHLYSLVSRAEFGNTVSWASSVRRKMRRVKLDTHCQHRSYAKGYMIDEFVTGTKPVTMKEESKHRVLR